MIIVLVKQGGLPSWVKVSLVILSLITAFFFGQIRAEIEVVEEVSEILLV